MTKLTQAQQQAMSQLAKFYNPKYPDESLCHVSDVAISPIMITRLMGAGLITANKGFISFTNNGLKVVGIKTEALL